MRKFESVKAALDYLWESACDIQQAETVFEVLGSNAFKKWPASIGHHANPQHQQDGGLAIHTAEVLSWAIELAKGTPLDKAVLTVAAIWHDYAKIFEYYQVNKVWVKDLGYRARFGHPYGSALAFDRHIQLNTPGSLTFDQVCAIQHCILSHHGRIEWGAVKEPATREALVLHTADMLSAKFAPPEAAE